MTRQGTIAAGAGAVVLLAIAIAVCRPQLLVFQSRDPDEWRPTVDPQGWHGYYVPTDLLDAVVELDRMLPGKTKREIAEIPPTRLVELHFGLGMALRNHWGLWRDSRLAKYFIARGVWHPDDMSAILIEAYSAHLHGRAVDPAELVHARTPLPADDAH
jgi:hypothetical protein